VKKALFAFVMLLFLVAAGSAGASDIKECKDYCTALNAEIQKAKQAGEEPNISSIHKLGDRACICNPLQTTNFTGIIGNILNFLFNIAIVLSPIMLVIAGVLFITAAGKPEQISKARQILIWTAVGFGVILLSRGLITIIQEIIGF